MLLNSTNKSKEIAMATIKIDTLNPVGSDFFNDSESFLDELLDEDMIFGQGEYWFWSSYCHWNDGKEGKATWGVFQWDEK
jgi:hypothetical protein